MVQTSRRRHRTYFAFKFKRRPLYYLFNLVIPTMFLSLVAMLTFFLPPESGEKISLGITVLLSLTVFLLLVAETMPPTSTVPVIGQYFASTMVLISISLAMSVAVLNMHHIGPDFRPVPPWIKKHILGTLANFLGMKTRPEPEGERRINVTGERLAQDFRSWEQQELLSIVQSQIQNSPRMRSRSSYIPCNGVPLGPDLCDDRMPSCPQEHGSTASLSNPVTRQHDVLKELLKEVRKLTNHIDEDKADNKIKDEWKRVALVLDRFFFFFFVLGTFGTYLIMLLQM